MTPLGLSPGLLGMCVDRAHTAGVLGGSGRMNTLRSTLFSPGVSAATMKLWKGSYKARLPAMTSSLISLCSLVFQEPPLSMAIHFDLQAVARAEPGAAIESAAGLPTQFRHRQLC